jgi:cold shock CspA family protein
VLLDEVSYPVMMHQVIEDRSKRNDALVNGLFVPQKELRAVVAAAAVAPTSAPVSAAASATGPAPADVFIGTVQSIKAGYGFIRPSTGGANIFFYYTEVTNLDFSELRDGDKVRYKHGRNERGTVAVDIEVLREAPVPA